MSGWIGGGGGEWGAAWDIPYSNISRYCTYKFITYKYIFKKPELKISSSSGTHELKAEIINSNTADAGTL